jgi:hypothetical protein
VLFFGPAELSLPYVAYWEYSLLFEAFALVSGARGLLQEIVMKAFSMHALVVAGLAGSVVGADGPVELEPDRGEVRHLGHIYFNIATGEKITTLIDVGDSQSPAVGDPGDEIWIANTGAQCAEFGYDTAYFFNLHDNDPCSSIFCNREWMLFDWGDIVVDTVVDCVTGSLGDRSRGYGYGL